MIALAERPDIPRRLSRRRCGPSFQPGRVSAVALRPDIGSALSYTHRVRGVLEQRQRLPYLGYGRLSSNRRRPVAVAQGVQAPRTTVHGNVPVPDAESIPQPSASNTRGANSVSGDLQARIVWLLMTSSSSTRTANVRMCFMPRGGLRSATSCWPRDRWSFSDPTRWGRQRVFGVGHIFEEMRLRRRFTTSARSARAGDVIAGCWTIEADQGFAQSGPI